MTDQKERKFYELPEQPGTREQPSANGSSNKEDLGRYISDNVIGKNVTFLSPFGRRKTLYCDYTASGKSLAFIEDYIREEVLPLYGNTHTTTSVTSLQTTLFRHEARDIIRNGVNAGERDAVIFTGSGCTGAVNKLVNALGDLQDTVVFISQHEHHSNILPYKEAGAKICSISSNPRGSVDVAELEEKLVEYKDKNRMIGAFNVCSNVTGVLEDDLEVTALLHKHGALAFWDYASAAPYVNIDMNPKVPEDPAGLCYKDAIYFSMHKFVGGCQTPGLLVAKKFMFSNRVPNGPGGGTVFFVSDPPKSDTEIEDHVHVRYLKDVETREEGGTPQIVESIRAGLVMKLKLEAGPEYILSREKEIHERALARWKSSPNLLIVGPHSESCLPIISFVMKHERTGLLLHFNFVTALLNDLFGIQVRGGCLCAGPYMQTILGLDPALTQQYEQILLEDSRLDRVGLRRGHAEHSQWEVLRPGVTRLNLSWFSSDQEIDFVVEAVSFVAEHGWKFLPFYRFNNETGDWYHSANTKFKDRRWLGHISFRSGKMEHLGSEPYKGVGTEPVSWEQVLDIAKELVSIINHNMSREKVPDQLQIFSPEASRLRWFVTPSEAKACLLDPDSVSPTCPPFQPPRYNVASQSEIPGSLHSHVINLQPDSKLSQILSSSEGKKRPIWSHRTKTQEIEVEKKQNGEIYEEKDILPNGDSKLRNVERKSSHEMNGQEHTNNDKIEQSDKEETNACSDGSCILPGGKRPGEVPKLKSNTAKWKSPPKEIFKLFLEAVNEFEMIQDGDRVLVGLSGGKDSLSLLHTLRQYMFYAKKSGVNFTLGAVTVDPMSSAYDPRPLIPYLQQLGIEYLYEEQDIMTQALKIDASSICAFCSRMKRGRLYAAARRKGYNVLALGQHLDDISESFLMSVFHNGRLRTMKACYTNSEGDIRIIRPFVYVRENSLRHFAESEKLPIIAENCPACFEAPKERQRVKQLLAQQELLFPRLYWNLKTALYPVMRLNKTGIESIIFGKHVAAQNVAADNQLTKQADQLIDGVQQMTVQSDLVDSDDDVGL